MTQPETPSFLDVAGAAGSHLHVMPMKAVANGLNNDARPGGGGRKQNTGIQYHGGPVLLAPRVAAIYWGTSTIYNGGPTPGTNGVGASDGSLVGFFLRNFAPSPYFNINHTYYDGSNDSVPNSVTYTGFWADNSDPGSAPSDAAIQAEVVAAVQVLGYDPNTVYLVFTGSGVNLGGGFGSRYCAYHGHFTDAGRDIKYAAEPYDFDFPSGCTAIINNQPNGDRAADAEVNTIAHETEEAATDPDLNAWFDRRGQENADKCAWTFGTTYNNGSGVANMNLGGKDFLIQRNWVDAGSGGCALAYP